MKISILVICVALLAAQGLQGAGAARERRYDTTENLMPIVGADDAQRMARFLNAHPSRDINEWTAGGWPLLLGATLYGAVNIVELLLMRHIDVDVEHNGENVWHMAVSAEKNRKEMIKLLGDQKVPGINYQGSGTNATPLIVAVKSPRDPKIVPLLLKYGANVTIQDNAGKTALDYVQNRINRALLLEAMHKKTAEKKE